MRNRYRALFQYGAWPKPSCKAPRINQQFYKEKTKNKFIIIFQKIIIKNVTKNKFHNHHSSNLSNFWTAEETYRYECYEYFSFIFLIFLRILKCWNSVFRFTKIVKFLYLYVSLLAIQKQQIMLIGAFSYINFAKETWNYGKI